ncbi:hypothetical protein ABZS29_12465 [Kribbella sp. NPDC005582]|uniref:hypothetical protein n=1 Tax=Kribbella sp. NPDC005582 TaxID=3156893 RepID=UPI0033A50CA8
MAHLDSHLPGLQTRRRSSESAIPGHPTARDGGPPFTCQQGKQEASTVMGEVIKLRPLVLGYARLAPFAGHGQHSVVHALLSSYANRAGLQLGTVYFDRWGSPPLFVHDEPTPAFNGLLAGLRESRAAGVVVPSLDTFGHEMVRCVAELEDDLCVVVHPVDAEGVHDPRDQVAAP